MRDLNVRSLRQLKRRKYFVKRQLGMIENQFQEDIYELTHPFTSQGGERIYQSCDNATYNSGFSKIMVNAMRVGEVLRLGFSIVNDFRKK